MSECMIVRRGGSKKLQTKTVTPSTSQQVVTPDSGYDGLSQVTVEAISPTKAAQTYTPGTSNQTISSGRWLTGAQTIKGDADLVAGNIKKGVNIFGVTGTYDGELSTDDALLSVFVAGNSRPTFGIKVTGNGYSETSNAYFQRNSSDWWCFFSIPPENFGTLTIAKSAGTSTFGTITVNEAGHYYQFVT